MRHLHSTPAPAPDRERPTVVARFLAATGRRREPKHRIDGEDYVTMLWRMIRAFERRAIDDPALLPQAAALGQRMTEVVNVVIAANAERYAIDPRLGASMIECARILGITKQTASARRARGVAVMAERIDRAGAAAFAEAQRERAAIRAAHEQAVIVLDDYRARHAA